MSLEDGNEENTQFDRIIVKFGWNQLDCGLRYFKVYAYSQAYISQQFQVEGVRDVYFYVDSI